MDKNYFRLIVLLIFAMLVACNADAETSHTSEKITLSGIVTDTDGKGIEAVQVTDGYEVVYTGKDGKYSIDSDRDKSRFVYITVPAEYEIPIHSQGHPLFYKEIPKRGKGSLDFVLKKRQNTMDKYTILVLGDIQITRGKSELRVRRLHNKIVPDIINSIKSADNPCIAISVGDLLSGDMSLYKEYREEMARLGIPVFNFVGNHDHDPKLSGDIKTVQEYEDNFGPSNYSFNIGQIHFVMLDDIIYRTKEDYDRGLTDDILSWLQKDLSRVAKGSTIILGMHIPLDTNAQRNADKKFYNNKGLLSLLKDYNVHVFTGHRHSADMYNYPAPYNIVMHLCPRTGGDHKINGDYCNDGTPSGYMVFDVDGTKTKWYHKTIGNDDTGVQMSAFSPKQTGTGFVFANVWYWDSEWENPEWWENGKRVADMEHHPRVDPNYDQEYRDANNGKPFNEKSWHMFRARPSAGVTKGTVKVTDRFGNIYQEDISW